MGFDTSDNPFYYIKSVKGAPVHKKKFLYDVLATAKQLRITKYFFTLSSTDLR